MKAPDLARHFQWVLQWFYRDLEQKHHNILMLEECVPLLSTMSYYFNLVCLCAFFHCEPWRRPHNDPNSTKSFVYVWHINDNDNNITWCEETPMYRKVSVCVWVCVAVLVWLLECVGLREALQMLKLYAFFFFLFKSSCSIHHYICHMLRKCCPRQ